MPSTGLALRRRIKFLIPYQHVCSVEHVDPPRSLPDSPTGRESSPLRRGRQTNSRFMAARENPKRELQQPDSSRLEAGKKPAPRGAKVRHRSTWRTPPHAHTFSAIKPRSEPTDPGMETIVPSSTDELDSATFRKTLCTFVVVNVKLFNGMAGF